MQLKISRFFVLIFVFTFLASLFPIQVFAGEEPPQSEIIITEVRLGGPEIELDGDIYEEYVTLYNQTGQALQLDDFRMEYIKDDFTGDCADPDWGGSPSTIRTFNTVIGANEALTFDYNLTNDSTLTNSSPGSIRVVEEDTEQIIIHDLIGWGTTSVCFENFRALMPPSGDSLQRYIDCETDLPIDTNDNLADFVLSEAPGPGGLPGPMVNCPEPDPDSDEENDGGMGGSPENTVQNSCEGVIITEILPNAAGPDTGNEFIELYNPTSKNISLEGCQLEATDNDERFTFAETELTPKQYMAVYDDTTGLTLTNSSGGSVYLLDTDNSEHEAEYRPDLDDDVAWAIDLSDNTWSITYTPTPGAKNEIVKVKPCPEGQFRNLQTNRCNKIAVEAGLGPCPTGKFRNPETNRCKNILDTGSQLKPCNPGQFRNPETNRCKSLSSSNSLVPCDPDEERNPETNRCRKVAGSDASDNKVKDVLSVTQAQDQSGWAMAGFSFIGATAYAVWEWRNEMLEKLFMLRNKLGLK